MPKGPMHSFAKLNTAITDLHDLMSVASDLVVEMESGKVVNARIGVHE